ncbi:MAG: hypothetical protein FWH40_08410 [Coriobacteriia bacterium]|nr:hypothetical protein [Coriobacteriia bacterium]
MVGLQLQFVPADLYNTKRVQQPFGLLGAARDRLGDLDAVALDRATCKGVIPLLSAGLTTAMTLANSSGDMSTTARGLNLL